MDWINLKDHLVVLLGLSKDALHVYAAVLLQLLAARVFGRSIAHAGPWILVLLFALGNEAYDWLGPRSFGQWDPVDGVHDVINTMFLPTLLMVVVRLEPGLFTSRS